METPYDWLEAHGDYLYRFALARLRDPVQAEDVVQETFLAAIQSTSFDGRSSARTWLTGILKHKIIDLMRKNSREIASDDWDNATQEQDEIASFFDETDHWAGALQAWSTPDSELQQSQFLAVLQSCLDKLPNKLARLFLLRDVHEEENEKICKELQITPTNAWVMLHRARLGLRQCLELNWE